MKKILVISLLLLVSFPPLLSQQRSSYNLKGTVIDKQNNETIVGASVIIKENPSKGSVTDINGKFSIDLPKQKVTLVFKALGYEIVEREVEPNSGITELNIELNPEAQTLNTVEVSGERYRTDAKKSIQTLEVVKLDVGSKNATTLDKALDP